MTSFFASLRRFWAESRRPAPAVRRPHRTTRLLVEGLEDRTVPATTGVAGGSVPLSNLQPSLALNYLIATSGVFPSRDSGLDADRQSPYLGEIRLFAGNYAPGGWAFAQGQTLQIQQNTALFSLLGTYYGGNGRTTFALPDLRGRSAIGVDPRTAPLGAQFGTSDMVLTSESLPSHAHTLPDGDSTGSVGVGTSFSNQQPGLGLNYLVSNVGAFNLLGDFMLFAGNFDLGGYFANGQTENISNNEPLFSKIGTIYGGDGVNTFHLPNASGRALLGAGTGTGLTTTTLGEQKGAESTALVANNVPAHSHSLPGATTDPYGSANPLPFANLEPTLTVNFIIALQGSYPSNGGSGAPSPFLGEIRPYAGNSAPTGWAFAQGQSLSIAQNTALYSILGVTYGGNGQTTFKLPDLQGRIPIGFGQGPNLPNYALGQQVGTETNTLTVSSLPAHVHVVANDSPDLDASSYAGFIYNENDPAHRIVPTISIGDTDGGPWIGGTLTAQLTLGGIASDRLSLVTSGGVTLNGTNVLFNGTVVGSVNGVSVTGTTPLTVTFNADATNAVVQAVARAIAYDSTSESLGFDGRTVTFVATDGYGEADAGSRAAVSFTVQGVNDAPTLAGSPTALAGTDEDTASAATLVSTLLAGLTVSDPDPNALRGIAVTAVAGNGTWQYSTDGTTWTPLTTSGNYVLLLDAATRVRYLPDGRNGETASLTLRAWDQSAGTASTNGNPQYLLNVPTGGTSPFSTGTASATLAVSFVNDAPTLLNSSLTLTGINEDSTMIGTSVGALLDAAGSADVDANALSGLAVTGILGNGVWQYSTNGTTWTNFGSVGNSQALLLSFGTSIQYLLDGRNGETASITFRAWDRTTGTASTSGNPRRADASVNGGTTAFSATTFSLNHPIASVNDAPTLTGDATLAPVAEDTFNPTGQTIAGLFANAVFSDPDIGSRFAGVLVVGNAAIAGQGRWQFSSDAGGHWDDVNNTSLVLAAGSSLRFLPALNYYGAPGSLTVRAFDDSYAGGFSTTTNGVTTRVNASPPRVGDTTPYAAATNSVSTSVTAVADRPAVTDATTTVGTQTTNGLGITPNAVDGSSVTYYQITGITNGTLYQHDGTTAIQNGDLITVQQGGEGLRFTPLAGLSSARSTFSFGLLALTNPNTAGGAVVSARITVNDVTAPNTAIDAGPPAYSPSTSATFTFSGTDDTGAADLTFESRLDNGDWRPAVSPLTLSGLAEGPHTLQVRALDATRNADPTPVPYIWTVDTTPPTVSLSEPSVAFANVGRTVTYTVIYADANYEDATLSLDDLKFTTTGTVSFGSIAVGHQAGGPEEFLKWTVTLNDITGDGTVALGLAAGTASDLAGNRAPAIAAGTPFTVDNTAPRPILGPPVVTRGPLGPIVYQVSYADANLGGVRLTAGDVQLVRTGTADAGVRVAVNGQYAFVTLENLTGDGTLAIALAAGTAVDRAGNPAPAAPTSTPVSIDSTPPTATLLAPSPGSTAGGPVRFQIDYNDANLNSVRLSAADVTLVRTGSADAEVVVSVNGRFALVTLQNVTGVGTLAIRLAAGTAFDSSGNPAPAAGPSAAVPVNGSRILTLAHAPTPSQAAPGGRVKYDLRVANTGNQVARNIVLRFVLPATASFVAAGSSAGWVDRGGGNFTLNLGVLAPGAVVRPVFNAQVLGNVRPGTSIATKVVVVDEASGGQAIATSVDQVLVK